VEKTQAPADPGLSSYQSENLSKTDRPELTSAKIIVSAGAACRMARNFHMLDKVADKLGAARRRVTRGRRCGLRAE